MTHSLQLICDIGRDLMQLADGAEGMEEWKERHQHVRLFAYEVYGDTDEADILSAGMTLNS